LLWLVVGQVAAVLAMLVGAAVQVVLELLLGLLFQQVQPLQLQWGLGG
jgi:hypothetical protein